MQQTSLLAYEEIRRDLAPRQAAVADCIATFGPMTNKDVTRRLRWPINSVTPRVLELRKKNIVRLARIDVDQSGRKCMYWELDEPG